MDIVLLGTGDTAGVPKIGCHCPACEDALIGGNSRRSRFSVLVETGEGRILIDTGPDLRFQLLKNGISSVDGVIWTHAHYDHYVGFGEFYRVQNNTNVYGLKETLDEILDDVGFISHIRHNIELYEPFDLIGLEFMIFEVYHPTIETSVGVCVKEGDKKLVVTSDTRREIPQKSMDVMMCADLMIADAITPTEFKVIKHMNTKEALELAETLDVREVILTHLSHYYPPHDIASKSLPLGYDGMRVHL
ncbi:MAG: MBL fold metallo-hydrolase [Halobacteriota archaeon]|nr:MBL fold metallo-hydrolase [Halobacteriota archaeon]